MSGVFNAKERSLGTKGDLRTLRKEGFVPGVVYGVKKDPVLVSINAKELAAQCKSLQFFSRILTLNIGNNQETVLTKAIQNDPVTDEPIHIDFQRIDPQSKIKVFVPIHFINQDKSPGIKMGGSLNIIIHSLEVYSLPTAIPESFQIDLNGVKSGTSFYLKNLKFPDSVTPVNPERDSILGTIVSARGSKKSAEGESSEAE